MTPVTGFGTGAERMFAGRENVIVNGFDAP
jgi:hypothetical protein